MNQEDPITTRLREGDPARDRTLGEDESRRMRARILGMVTDTRPVRWHRPAFASALLILIAVAGWIVLGPGSERSPDAAIPTPMAQAVPTDGDAVTQEEKTTRQVQYTTPGGTRVIWTLDPDFQL